MTNSKYIFDSWFDELYEDLCWEQACKEQDNYEKAFFRDLEKHLNALAMKKTKEVEKIGRSFARYDEGDFSLLKVDKSEQEKIYAKIYSSKLPNQDFSCRFGSFAGLSEASRKETYSPSNQTYQHATQGTSCFLRETFVLRKC